MIYAVAHWSKEFENDRSRGLARVMWLPLPNRFDSGAYWRMMEEPDAAVLFASWVWILQVASRCATRGVLVKDSGIAHDALSLAERVRGRPEWFERGLAYFLATGWLCEVVADTGPSGEARFVQPPRTAGGRATIYGTIRTDSPPVERGSRITERGSSKIEDDSSPDTAGGPPPHKGSKPFLAKAFELPFGPEKGAADGGSAAASFVPRQKKKKTQPLKGCVSKSLAGATDQGPTREVVLAFAAGCAIPEPAAEAFMDYFARRGWRDSYGRPVFSWRGRLRLWAKDWEKRVNHGKRPAPGLGATERGFSTQERVTTAGPPPGPSIAIPELVAGLRRAVAEAQPRQRHFEGRTFSPVNGARRNRDTDVVVPEAPQPAPQE